MENRKQVLIHLHTSGVSTTPSNLALGEIAVRHADEKPELLIRKNNDSLAHFIDEVAIDTKIATAKTELEGQINGVSASVVALSGAVDTKFGQYYDKEAANLAFDKINAAANALTDAKAYTDSAKTELNASIQGVSSEVVALSGAVDTKFGEYYTKDEADAAFDAKDAAANALKDAKAYTDSAKTELNASIQGVSSEVVALSGAVDTKFGEYYTKDEADAAFDIAGAAANALKDANAYTDSAKTELSASIQGVSSDVDAVSGLVKTLIGSDNGMSVRAIAIDEIAVQLTSSAISESFDTLKEMAEWLSKHPQDVTAMNSAITANANAIQGVSAEVVALSGAVDTKFGEYYTKDEADAAFDAKDAAANALTAAKAYTDSAKTELNASIKGVSAEVVALSGAVDTKFGSYYTKNEADAAFDAKGAAASALTDANAYTDSAVSALSASTVAIDGRLVAVEKMNETVTDAIHEIDVEGVGATVSASIEPVMDENGLATGKNKAVLDLSTLVIDCGTF